VTNTVKDGIWLRLPWQSQLRLPLAFTATNLNVL